MATDTIDKCANPACHCRKARESDFCESACELNERPEGAGCACRHAVCEEAYAKAAEGLKDI
jgi:hypothetical protein